MKLVRKSPSIGMISLIFGLVLLVFFLGDVIKPGSLIASCITKTYLLRSSNPEPAITNISSTSTGWLDLVNKLRSQSGLNVVTENANWNEACRLHSRYMVKNDTIEHDEDPENPWYTPGGVAAAQNSNIMVSSNTRSLDQDAINLWMSEPFHGVGIIDPQLERVGFGSYRESIGIWKMAATLDVINGYTSNEPPAGTYPVMWPPDGQTTNIISYDGTEWPNPLTSCPGYKIPSGPPIYLQIGAGELTPDVTESSFQKDGANLKHCIFDETSYLNAGTGGEQALGRSSLNFRDAIILIPESPLLPGATYRVSITSNGFPYTWSFTALVETP